MALIGGIIGTALQLFLILMFARFVVDLVQIFARSWVPSGPVLVVLEVIYTITDPPIKFVRRFVPPLKLGQVMLDLSFIIVLISVYILMAINATVFLRT